MPEKSNLKLKSLLKHEEDGNIVLQISIPWEDVKRTRLQVISQMSENVTLPGFRKGKAPKDLLEANLNPERVREETLKQLLPPSYIAVVKEHDLKPIINPKIHVDAIEEEKEWTFTAITCEMPEIDLGKYKESVKQVTAGSKIIIPGQEKKEPSFEEILKALLSNIKFKIPNILLEQEIDRLLSQTLNEVKMLGLTLEQYLASTKKTPENLRAEYRKKAENDIALEFILQKIAEVEKITVSEPEVNEAILKAKDPQEKQNLETNRYLLTSILRQQKTLDFLKNL